MLNNQLQVLQEMHQNLSFATEQRG